MKQRWQDRVGLVLGVILVLSPWLMGFSAMTTAAASAWVIGGATVVFFAAGLYKPTHRWEEWVNIALAAILAISPFVLGFTAVLAAAYTHWVMAALIGADAVWALANPRRQSGGAGSRAA